MSVEKMIGQGPKVIQIDAAKLVNNSMLDTLPAHQAVCPGCGWTGGVRFAPNAAKSDCDRHARTCWYATDPHPG